MGRIDHSGAPPPVRTVAPATHATWRLTTTHIALAIAAVAICWALSRVLLLIFFSILVAASLRGAADWVVARTRLPQGIALALVVLALGLVLWSVFYWSGTGLYAQLNDLTVRLAGEARSLGARLKDNPLMGGAPDLPGIAEQVVAPAAHILSMSVTSIIELVVALITAIYFAMSPKTYVGGLIRLIPIERRARVGEVVEVIGHVLRMWVLGQMIDMAAVGVLVTVGLWLVGAPAPIALGLIAGMFTFVPYLGTIVSGIIAVLVGLSASLSIAAWAVGVFALVHVVEGYVIGPMVQKRILEIPAALTVLSMTVLGSLFGLPGIVLGTPLAATLMTLVQALYVGDALGDHSVDPTRH